MNKVQKKFFVLATTLTLGCSVFLALTPYFQKQDWKGRTSPLLRETVVDLCEKFSLSEEHRLCNGSRDVYAFEFIDVVKERFPLDGVLVTPKNHATIKYQEVQGVMGEYQSQCEDVVHSSDYSYFRCYYDFQGDDSWVVSFFFYHPEETLFSIRAGWPSYDD